MTSGNASDSGTEKTGENVDIQFAERSWKRVQV